MTSMVVVPITTTYLPTSMTLGEAKARVARVVSGSSSPDMLQVAEEAIQDALRRWARYHNWSYLNVQHPDITVVAGTADYTLDANFQSPLSVRLTGAARRLLYHIDQRFYDRSRWDQTASELPRFYSLFLLGQERKIRIIPTPIAGDVLSIRYHRTFVIPTGDDGLLDAPDTYIDGILDLARARVLADRPGSETRRDYFASMAEDAMQRARFMDLNVADENDSFVPAIAPLSPALTSTTLWAGWSGW